MASIVRFVNAIVDSPTTALDLNSAPLMVDVDGIDMSPPEMRRTQVQTFLGTDGDVIVDTAPENRLIKIPLNLVRVTTETAAKAITDLHTQLSKPRNILMVQLDGMTKPVFFRTYAAPDYSLKMLRLLLAANTKVELEIPAEPYGYGPKVTLSQRTMYNSLFNGPLASINGDFETNVTGWEMETGSSTFSRYTGTFHAGAACMEVDPNGTSPTVRVRLSANVTASPGQQWRARAWIRNSVSRTCNLDIGFFNGSSLIGSWTTHSLSIPAVTWQYFDISATAPANTTGVRVAVSMGGTPGTNDFMQVDEVKLNEHHVDGSMYTDISGVLGDTDTPMFLRVVDNVYTAVNDGQKMTLLSMRKGGNPANVPNVIESETLTGFTDTTWLLDNYGGTATNGSYIATTFATNANLVKRMSTMWPTAWSSDLRGRYDVYIRVRGSSGNVYKFQLRWGSGVSGAIPYAGEVITVPNTPTSVWFYIYAGTIAFPSGFDVGTDGYSETAVEAAQMYIQLDIQRVSGSNGFDVDTINFFPADDESCLIRWPEEAACTEFVVDGRKTAVYGLDGSGRALSIPPCSVAGAVPMLRPGVTNRLFLARDVGYGATSTQALGNGDNANETTTITPFYWPRYWMIRQATT